MTSRDAQSPDSSDAPPSRRPLILLGLGSALGLALAAAGLIDPPTGSLLGIPSGAVARVNDAVIQREDFERLVAGVDSDTRGPVTPERRRQVLDRMIDEELLVQRALELGLAQLDRRVRADLTQAVIASVVAEADDEQPSDRELRAFYEENLHFFTLPGRLRVRQVYFRVRAEEEASAVLARAEGAKARLLAGEPFLAVRDELGDREISAIPDTLLPPLKLREYVGPTVMRAARELEVGDISEPIRSGTGVHVLDLVDAEPPETTPFEEVSGLVRNEWQRRQGDLALRRYLDDLRDRSEVETVGDP